VRKLRNGKTTEATRRLRFTDWNAYKRQHYAENAGRLRAKGRAQARERKAHFVAYLGGKCFDCGVAYPSYIFDFDHRDPSEKRAEPSALMAASSMERIKEEIDRCDLVCANCHRHRTYHSKEVAEKLRASRPGVDETAERLVEAELGFSSGELFAEEEYDDLELFSDDEPDRGEDE